MQIKKMVIGVGVMLLVTAMALLVLSGLVFLLEWQADKAMVGITCTYILVGFCGGLSLNLMKRGSGKGQIQDISGEQGLPGKMIEAIVLGCVYMLVLILVSLVGTEGGFGISGRFFTIWMLVLGSGCLGRLL